MIAPRSHKRCIISILALILSLTSYAVAAPPSDAISPHDIAQLYQVTEVQIAPAGDRIAYVLSVPRKPGVDDNGPSWAELHVVDVASGQSRPFVTGHVNVSKIHWTLDGSGIAFLAKRHDDKETALYIIPIDGGEARKVVTFQTSIAEYELKPDGKQIAFLASAPLPDARKKLQEKGFDAQVYEEDWQPVRVYITDADPQTPDEPLTIDLPGSAFEVHWNPAGDRLVVALAPRPLIDDSFMYRRLRIIDVSSKQIIMKIENPGKLGSVRWSPDGQRLAFLSGEDINDPSEGRLMIASVSDGTFAEIMKDYLPNISAVEWLDNERLFFLADDGCYSALGTVRADGQQRDAVAAPGETILMSASLSKDGNTAALVGHTPRHPGEAFVYTRASGTNELRRITQHNAWLDKKRLAAQEVVRYEARDGETIEGVLVRPLDERPGQRYPLVVAVHGGPESHVPHGWVTSYANPGQMAAAMGMFVLYPNYRGSTGRGVAFAKAHQGDYGGKEFDDLIDGVDHLISLGLVDSKKVGITGASYGGYATAWCSTRHSERFAAGVMFVGISDKISKSGTTDIPDEMYLVHARKRLWEDWQFFLERSPIYHVQKAKTPLLILHGRDDTRVPPSQSMELFRHLKTLGQAPVRLILYPGEGHGNRKATSRLDYSLRMLHWFEHYLQGSGGTPPSYEIDYGIQLNEK